MAYRPAPQKLGGIRIFFSIPLLWDFDLLSFRVKDFANAKFRFSHLLHPGEPFTPMITYFTRRSRRYTPINSRDPMWPLPLQFSTTDKSSWITTLSSMFMPSFPVALVVTRCLIILSDVLEILGSLLLWRFFLPTYIMVDSICLSILHLHPLSLPY